MHRPPAFTSHLQAWQWAESELANLAPALQQVTQADDDALTWQLPVAFGVVCDLFRHLADIIPGLRAALTVSRKLGDRAAQARVLISLAEAYQAVRELGKAIECCQDAFPLYAEMDDWYGQWSARQLEGIARLSLGQFIEAVDRLEQALTTARQASDPRTEGMSLTWLGAAHERLGASQAAIGLREQAVTALKLARNRWQYAYGLLQLAETYSRHGRSSAAIVNYEQAQAIFRQIGDRRTEADTLLQLGHAQQAAGHGDTARQSWQQALAVYETLRDPRADQVRAQVEAEASRRKKAGN